AAHAVIAAVLGMPCQSATIVPEEVNGVRAQGRVIPAELPHEAWEDQGKFRDDDSQFVARILYAMAGAEAQKMFTRSWRKNDDGVDRETISVFFEETKFTEERYELRLRQMTRMLCRRHEHLISKVADI